MHFGKKQMRHQINLPFRFSVVHAVLCLAGVCAAAPAAGALPLPQQPPAAPSSAQPAAPQRESQSSQSVPPVPKQDPPPVTKAEEDAFQAFASLQNPDTQQIIVQGQEFLSKYAISPYRPLVYGKLEVAYLNTNQLDKLVSTGQLALNEYPDNLDVLAMMASILPRLNPEDLDASQRLDLAERYARRALRLGSSLNRPAGLSEEQFTRARNEKLAMAHTGLGIVYYRRGDTASSVSELDQATKLDPTPEPIDFYLLGDGEMKLKKYSEAADAFDRCARAQWSIQWQERCKQGEAAARKASATQPMAHAKP
jgi:tetratricopeptide (TPR) repeat protein